jgi:hypothetical protein
MKEIKCNDYIIQSKLDNSKLVYTVNEKEKNILNLLNFEIKTIDNQVKNGLDFSFINENLYFLNEKNELYNFSI